MFYESDICSYFTDSQGNLYQMIGWCPSPTAILQNMETKEIEYIVYNCLNAESYVKLVPEKRLNNGRNKQEEN